MPGFEEKYNRKRYRASYGTTVMSIALVLFMLGLFALIVFHARKLSQYIRENIGVSVMLKENAGQKNVAAFRHQLDTLPAVKSTELITSDAAAKKLADDLGEDFVGFLGYNPLPTTIVLHLNAPYTVDDSVAALTQWIRRNNIVREVDYQQSMVEMVNRNLTRAGRILLGFSLILLLISVVLIYNTIRLAVYSRRLLIKSMLLVGATQTFIRKPFIISGLLQGLLGGAIAVTGLAAVLFFAQQKIPEVTVLSDLWFIVVIFAGVVVFGMMITWLSNFFAVKKYLKFNSDALY